MSSRPDNGRSVSAAVAALLALFLFSGPGLAADWRLYRVEIDAPAALRTLLEENLDIVRWSTRENVSDDQVRQLFETAPRQIRTILATEGYFSPSIQPRLDRTSEIWVTRYRIDPGESTTVKDVGLRFTGVLEPEREREARDAFDLRPGRTFRQADWSAAKEKPLRSLQRKRYAAARITESEAAIDPASRSARLRVDYDSGPAFRFGQIRVTGLQRYPERIVRSLNPIEPGSPYDEDALLRFQRRLQLSGYFASAIVSSPGDPALADATPVDVTVVEGAARRLEAGAGISTDRGPRAQIQYTDNNVLDRPIRLRASAKIDRVSQEAIGAISTPRGASGHVYGLEGRYNFQDIQGEQRTNWSSTLARTFALETRESQQGLQFLTERRALAAGVSDNRQALYLMQTWRWNNLDDVLAPRKGFALSLQVGGASRSALSSRSFGRVNVRSSYLLPISTFGTFVVRGEFGSVIAGSRESIPSAYLYRAGGDASIRGYPLDSLGVQEGGAIVGGRYLAVGTLEYIQWIKREWGAAVFVDGGNATDSLRDFQPVYGYGVGARWSSPIGSLNLDIGYGEAIHDWRLHFGAGIVLR